MDEKLMEAAEAGDIGALYALIKLDLFILERVEQVPFIDTPLHVAVSAGHERFSMEILNLKPSFAWKLNPDGLSPLHLALQHQHINIVYQLLCNDDQLTRVEGREGLTPLHYAAGTGMVNVLADFLSACSASIEDRTIRKESALHIAARNDMVEALEVLLGWLPRVNKDEVLDWCDDEGNIVLHIATSRNLSWVMRLLINRVDVNTKNYEGLTALDMLLHSQKSLDDTMIKDILCQAGAKKGSSLPRVSNNTAANYFKSKIPIYEKFAIRCFHDRLSLSSEGRSALLVVATLIVTATYQAGLSPAGGVQDDDCNPPLSGAAQMSASSSSHVAGRAVMKPGNFVAFALGNNTAFYTSVAMSCLLVPCSAFTWPLYLSMVLLLWNYGCSMVVIWPTEINMYIAVGSFGLIAVLGTVADRIVRKALKKAHHLYKTSHQNF